MKKKEAFHHQVLLLSVALVVAVVIIIATAFIIITQIKMKNTSDDLKPPEVTQTVASSVAESKNDLKNEDTALKSSLMDTQNDSSKSDKATNFGAVEYINCSSGQLLELFKAKYESDGYYNGGYVIHNYEVCPYLQFIVTQYEDQIVDNKITGIFVNPKGMVLEKVFVGMTYSEIKAIVGNKLSEIVNDTENDNKNATIDMTTYTIKFIFDKSSGISTLAILKNK